MDTRTLGNSDLTVSRVCLGTMTFGAQVDEPTAASMIDRCLEADINFIDTANAYNAGKSEEIVGRVLKGRRDRVILASKVGIKMGDSPDEIGLSRTTIQKQLEESLRRLQTDYLDVYYLHQPDYSIPLEETLATVDRFVEQGKIRHVGLSNFASWQACRILWLAETHGYRRVTMMQPMYNLLARNIEQEFLPMCQELGLSTVVYNPLAGGLLTGKHHANQPPIQGTRFDSNPSYHDRYWHPLNFDAVERLQIAARTEERSLISLAFGWLFHHTQADCVLLGASRIEQLLDNLKAIEEGPCSEESIAACNDAWQIVRGISPVYNR